MLILQRLLGLRLWAELLGRKNEENRPSFQGPHSLLRKPDSEQITLGQWDRRFAGGRTRSERAARCSLRGGEWKMAPRFRLPGRRVVPFTGTGAQQEQRLGKKIDSVWGPLRLTAMLVGHQVEVTK